MRSFHNQACYFSVLGEHLPTAESELETQDPENSGKLLAGGVVSAFGAELRNAFNVLCNNHIS